MAWMGVTEEVDRQKRFNGGMDDEQGHKNDPAVVEENLSIVFRIPDDHLPDVLHKSIPRWIMFMLIKAAEAVQEKSN